MEDGGEVERGGEDRGDVSRERKEELREAALIFESIIRESPLAIEIFDREGKILIWNPAAERLLGWSADEVIGRPPPMIPEEARHEVDLVHSATLKGDRFTGVETRLRRKDGNLMEVSLSTAPFHDPDGEIRGAMEVLVDISERKRAEEVLSFLSRISAEITRSLTVRPILNRLAELMLPLLGDFVAIDLRGEDGKVERIAAFHVDPEMADVIDALKRYPLMDPDPRTDSAGSIMQPTILYEVTDNWFVHTASSVEHFRLLRQLAPRSIMVVPLTARGRHLGSITLGLTRPGRSYGFRDLELAMEVARRGSVAVENAQLFEETEQAVKSRDEVMAVVSHDLRNPINNITMTVDLLREMITEGEARRLVDTVARSVGRMERLIGDLLDVTRIESDGLTFEMGPVDPGALAAEAAQLQQALAQENGITIETRIEEGIPTIQADRERLLQVFQNLIDNSMRFTPEGGLIIIGAEGETDGVRFYVQDTGAGIDPEELPHLFDRFWQASKKGGGAGLGLTIARGIVEAHGGTITAESTPGRGTRMVFTVPYG